MSIKTNKAYSKRIKVTKNGKLLVRSSGQNHFNAKERQSTRAAKGRDTEFHMKNKERSKFLVNL